MSVLTGEGAVRRRGLPRVSGGPPWPPAGELATGGGAAVTEVVAGEAAVVGAEVVEAVVVEVPLASRVVRRGLPRVPGGGPWPAAVLGSRADTETRSLASVSRDPAPKHAAEATAVGGAVAAQVPTAQAAAVAADVAPATLAAPIMPTPAIPAVLPATQQSAAAARPSAAIPAPSAPAPARRPARRSRRLLALLVAAVLAAGIIVLAARGVTTLPGVPEFLERFPGEYELPKTAEPGFPVWLRWSHFLNFFMMVLILRSGLLVRRQQKPPALYTPRRGGTKVSIYLWLHTSLDVLWLANGAAFVVLLFVTGNWVRIVPTSWEVFPNAASALLQYLTLDWPVENGWVNYNSLQQLMYFTVVFVAAPLAALSGVRMSEWWPKNAERLNRIYPAPVARAIHFPTMLFFVLFTIIHVFLVLATGALRNLNHMFAGQDVVNWVGLWWFAAGILATVLAVLAARPLVLAPIARLTGSVSNR